MVGDIYFNSRTINIKTHKRCIANKLFALVQIIHFKYVQSIKWSTNFVCEKYNFKKLPRIVYAKRH